VSRKLVGIEVGGEPLPFEITRFWPAFRGGEEVGHVTDLIRSPRLERNIGYVWVPIALAAPGTELEVGMPDGSRAPARTAALPFLDPKKDIPRS
jgi:glycine cleavage system aminomethyltransferase T